jgi:P4 family phage/plasmid primase-like protien
MDPSLRKFISSRQEKGEGYYTHVSQIQPTGKFNLTRKDIEEWWDLYCDTLDKNPNMVSGMAERPGDFIPVLNDSDIKIPFIENKHSPEQKLYRDTHIRQTAMIYQKYLKQTVKNYERHHGICFVLEKPFPTIDREKGEIKHGFHLHFINAIMHKIDQDVHLIPRVRKEVGDKSLFKDIGIVRSEDVIDRSCTSKFWLLYGSRKKEFLQSYKVTKILDDECCEISLEDALKNFKLKDIHGDPLEIIRPLEYYLPRILSIHPGDREPILVRSDLELITKKLLKRAKESKKVYEDIPVPEALKRARELMKLVSPSRADNFDDWLDIGWILYNIGDGTEDALDMWIEFSAKTSKKNFSESACMYQWENMEKRNRTIGSLYYYAKTDSPEEYKKIQRKENERLFNESLNGGHYDMAKWLHNKYKGEFVCACPEKKVWFHFKNHRWVVNKQGVDLRRKISTELVNEYKNMKKRICEDMGDQDDDAELQKRLKTVNKLISNLKSTPFKNNIISECVELFVDDSFIDRLDSNVDLIHFTNGVLDLKELRFREGKPTDYISLTTGYDFKEYSWDSQEVIEVDDHFTKVFPDPELKRYWMEYTASLLRGINSSKTFLTMSGEGDNAKSVNMDLLKLTLGRYMKILPTSLISGKRTQSSQATPEYAGLPGVRFAVLQEPNSKDVINIGILKELSGNDIIYYRGLYKDSQELKPQFKLALVCNKLPKLPCDDPATWNRIRVLPHESCFPKDSSTVPELFEDQVRTKRFPRDPYFSDKLPHMKSAFMWMMFETHKKILKDGRMDEPEKVKSATAIYRQQNDVFLQFIMEKIVCDPKNEKAQMSVVETYNSFKTWFDDSYPNLHFQIPSKEELREEMTKKWGELSPNYKWKGYRLRTSEDDEREGKVIIIREEDLLGEDEVNEEEEKVDEHEEHEEHDEHEEDGSDDKEKFFVLKDNNKTKSLL